MQSSLYYLHHPKVAGFRMLVRLGKLLPDFIYLKWTFRLKMGYSPNLKSPKSFSEKLLWLKLYNRNKDYTVMVDKVKVKDFVAPLIGDEYIIPTLGVWEDPEKIDFDSLPNRFVLKVNHNSGKGMYICKDKSKMDVEKVKARLREGLKENYYLQNREWPYKDVPRRILAEQYIDPKPSVQDLPDYKWYCFGGEPKFCQVIQDRNTCETIDFFDADWNHQEFVGLNPKAGNAVMMPARPKHLDTHLQIARKLSKNIPFSRIDLYDTGERVYFGEISFFPASGMGSFRPEQYNEILGQMIILPHEKHKG